MNDTQLLTLAIGSMPTFLAVLIGILINNARLSDLRGQMDARFADVDKRFNDVDKRFNEVNRRFDSVERRFDDVKEMWRTELRRVEEVIDARLKHLEEHRP